MRIAVLGAGRIGIAHLSTLAAVPGIDELIVADPDRERSVSAAAAVGASSMSIDEALASRPDGIVITAPTPAHPDLVRAGISAGIPVFCEKPLAQDVAGSRALVEDCEGSDVPVQIGFQRRFDAGYRSARQAVRRGDLGELRRVHLMTCDPAPPSAEYIASSGGIFRDCHVHDFDVLRWVTGSEVATVHAVGANRGADYFRDAHDVDESAALLTMTDGTLVTLSGSRYNGAGYDVRMELAGTVATLLVGLDEQSPLRSAEARVPFPGGAPYSDFQHRFAAAYATELEEFVRVVRGEVTNPCTPRDALAAQLIAEAAQTSRREGRTVDMAELNL